LTVVTLLTSFLPLTNASSYIPALFKIWEAFNSTYIDDRMVELLALLAEEHVAGKGEDGYGLPFNDVGIFEEVQWVRIMRACLGSMSKLFSAMNACAVI
jgi:proteasome activator subunit 4